MERRGEGKESGWLASIYCTIPPESAWRGERGKREETANKYS